MTHESADKIYSDEHLTPLGATGHNSGMGR
ncbi:hypothetical protein SAMN05216516_11549 [Izhakiella capsodis]|uniref:Uncharacterized protein n=1 Tax=Izhakiella capsodis TaxID=1367852 RepID=A0A1I5BAX4_9GAMM|nr:hypothetical protein SAMN05216516_11549 [Izhakiella capsodis]